MAEGPRGGDTELTGQTSKPEWRRDDLHTEVLPNGEMGLHRFSGGRDTAAPGHKNEQVWHRMAAFMLNAGRTNSEIAMAAGVTPQSVSMLKAQRWFQQLCATIANSHGEEVVGAIQSEALNSVNTIVAIRDSDAAPRTRLAAAQILVEQAHGKPTQKVISAVSHSIDRTPQEEMAELQQELKALRKENV